MKRCQLTERRVSIEHLELFGTASARARLSKEKRQLLGRTMMTPRLSPMTTKLSTL